MNNKLLILGTLATVMTYFPSHITAAEAQGHAAHAHDDHGHEDHDHDHDHHAHEGHGHEDHGHEEDAAHAGEHTEHAEHGGEHEAHEDAVTLSAEIIKRFNIISEPVRLHSLSRVILAPGWITYNPAAQAQLVSLAEGKVSVVHVQTGDSVKKDEPLIEIISPAYVEAQSRFILKQSVVLAAQSQLDATTKAVERGEKSVGSVSLAELQRRETEWSQAKIAVLQAQAELTAALSSVRLLGPSASELDRLIHHGEISDVLILRSPIDATVVERAAVIGQYVDASTESLVHLADLKHLWVVANVPESQIAAASKGSHCEIFAFDGSRIGESVIDAVTPAIDPHTRSGRVQLRMTGNTQIRPGMYVQVRITPGENAESDDPRMLAVPESALMNFEGGSVVFKAEVSGTETRFSAQPVVVGPSMAGYVPIFKGINLGDHVVVEGAFLIKADIGKAGAAHVH